MYTCISFFVLFVHPLPVKHKSYREEKKMEREKWNEGLGLQPREPPPECQRS